MDRVTTYYGALARAVDLLKTNQNAMVGLGMLAQSVLGSSTLVDGFTLSPTSPASLSVVLGAGQVYQQAPLEGTALSALPVDTHVVLKQGILLDPYTQTLTPPNTIGQAVNVLIQVQYQDADTDAAVLNYYNAADPTTPLRGPGNTAQPQATMRRGTVAIQAKYGVPATAGAQATPNPDAGWSGLYVVTLSYGQNAISAGNIVQYAGVPLIGAKLGQIPQSVQSNTWNYAVDTGASGLSIAANLFPLPQAIGDGFKLSVKLARDMAPGAALTVNSGSGAVSGSIVRLGNAAFGVGDFRAGDIIDFVRNGTTWILQGASQTLSVIDAPITRTVGGPNPDFVDLPTAIAWLQRRRIIGLGSIVFQLAAGVGATKLIQTSSVVFLHPDGSKVSIVGQPLQGPITQPGVMTYSGNGSAARASDTAANLNTLRSVYSTELLFTNGSQFVVIGNIGLIQDVLITSDGSVANTDNLLFKNGVQTLTRVSSFNSAGAGLRSQSSTTYINGICHTVGNTTGGVSADYGTSLIVNAGGSVLGAFSNGGVGINSSSPGSISCLDLTTASTLYARGNAGNGIQGNAGNVVCSSSSQSRNNVGDGFFAVNSCAFRAVGCVSDGNYNGFTCSQGSYMDASSSSGTNLNVGFYAYLSSNLNRAGTPATTCTGAVAVASPALGTTGNSLSQVY